MPNVVVIAYQDPVTGVITNVEPPIPISVSSLPLPAGGSTEGKQDSQIVIEQAILAKIIVAPATEAKQNTGNVSLASIDGKLTNVEDNTQPVTASTVYNVTLTLADTEYSQALPANTRQFRFRCRTAFAVRFAFVTGKVATPTAPYLTLPANGDYYSDENKLGSLTLYLASSEAGVVVELECWT